MKDLSESRIERLPLAAELVERLDTPNAWGVEAIDPEGGIQMATFYGPEARARALEYARAKFQKIDVR